MHTHKGDVISEKNKEDTSASRAHRVFFFIIIYISVVRIARLSSLELAKVVFPQTKDHFSWSPGDDYIACYSELE